MVSEGIRERSPTTAHPTEDAESSEAFDEKEDWAGHRHCCCHGNGIGSRRLQHRGNGNDIVVERADPRG